jgi:hypothetical protein
MIRSYLERGLKAGALGGLAFGLFVALVGNPLVGYVETLGHGDHGAHAHAAGEGGSIISAATTNAVSVGGGVLWGLFLGAVVFGVVYYVFEPAIPGTGATKRYVLAGAGFVTASGAPWLVLPPQPAGVEATLSTPTRQLWFGVLVVSGALVCVLAGYAYNRLTARGVDWPLAALGASLPFALLAVPVAVAPAAATAGELPASMVAAYRGFVIFGQAGLWFVLASAHTWLAARETESSPTESDLSLEDPAYPAD